MEDGEVRYDICESPGAELGSTIEPRGEGRPVRKRSGKQTGEKHPYASAVKSTQ
jgi:hypothetical protein